ncbi:DUF4382 domain-containing protein [Hymenobacter guriensis]|uniref:DUF4382 domain-containing protein n=1 Tax=Hymenobacter guriensis TaxID=2793065 RepID=A0ABS0L5A9_9BACT|nr:DUF4382 domain-containing protein [Hymenobacter guriensis]MBG8554564.1 DUF4382 domain-containing protein [Hymenobacter guriensis]
MKFLRFLPLALASLAFAGCNDDNETDNDSAAIQVLLIDAPGDYKAVNIDLQKVQVNATNAAGEEGWQDLDSEAGKYNLLSLVNGSYAFIAGQNFPAGHIEQIRLVLGPNNTLTLKDGTTVDLKVPSGQTSGLKINVNEDLKAGVTYSFVLDFDVAKSVVARGNGEYNLKPVIRAVPFALAGSIKGTVTPLAAKPQVMAIRTDVANGDTINTYTDANGGFQVFGAKAGTYRLEFKAAAPYKDTQKENVSVVADNVTSVGVITLTQ